MRPNEILGVQHISNIPFLDNEDASFVYDILEHDNNIMCILSHTKINFSNFPVNL